VRQHRPALVVSTAELEQLHGLLWVAMITAAENRRWPDDVAIGDLKMAGLPIPSIIRPSKLATVEAAQAERRGTIQPSARRHVASALARYLPRTA
jgi:mRNA interferase MazF